MPFYAYLHMKPGVDVSSVFYVGKGQRDRVNDFYHRTAHHKNVVAKYGRDNITKHTIPCSSEEIAMDLERGLIRRFRVMGVGIINLTDGGEGLSGHRHTPETKAKMRAARVGKPRSEETKRKLMSKPIVQCPYCDVVGREGGAMARYHFLNCKERTDASVA